jgi:hypothetical protein
MISMAATLYVAAALFAPPWYRVPSALLWQKRKSTGDTKKMTESKISPVPTVCGRHVHHVPFACGAFEV